MIDFEIVKRQIIKACKNLEITNIEDMRTFTEFFRWYYQRYFELFGKEHKRVTVSSIEYAIYGMTRFDEIMGADDKVAVLQELAEQYFSCEFTQGTDYSISHFAVPGILQNRIYEVLL